MVLKYVDVEMEAGLPYGSPPECGGKPLDAFFALASGFGRAINHR
jgi:hypothetical protein